MGAQDFIVHVALVIHQIPVGFALALFCETRTSGLKSENICGGSYAPCDLGRISLTRFYIPDCTFPCVRDTVGVHYVIP